MATRNDITGDTIASRGNSETYRDNWDAIFGKKKADECIPESNGRDQSPVPAELNNDSATDHPDGTPAE